MTGDEIDPAKMVYADETDAQVATRVRMLYRDQLDHEAVCTGARDRIMYLSQQLEKRTTEVHDYKAAAIDAESRLINLTERLLEFADDVKQWVDCPCGDDNCDCAKEEDCNCPSCEAKKMVSDSSKENKNHD